MSVKVIPDGYHSVQPYLTVPDVEAQFAFLGKVFGGTVIEQIPGEDGKVRHGEVRIGDSVVMMGRAREAKDVSKSTLYVYLADADAAHQNAMAAGAREIQAPADMPYGDRTAAFADPAGNSWWVATRKENLTPEEIARRMQG
jgi:uncharacterized glyoxalase superfamily protein PhnB